MLARLEAILSSKIAGSIRHPAITADYIDALQIVSEAKFVVVRIVRGRNFDHA